MNFHEHSLVTGRLRESIMYIFILVFTSFVIAGSAHVIGSRPGESQNERHHRIHTRIVGGHDARPFQYPWQASLQVLKKGAWEHYCGATLISPYHVLTAAHCLVNADLAKISVHLGITHVRRNFKEHSEQVILVKDAKVHPKFNPISMSHDVGVIILANPAILNDRVKTVRLADQDASPVDQFCVTTGWGNASKGGEFIQPSALQALRLTVIGNEICEQRLKKFSKVDESMICAHDFSGGRGTCTGDSGGPLVCADSQGPFLAGIVSWGVVPCGEPEYPSVFSRVSTFLDFIELILLDTQGANADY